jgi:transcriptional regulator GlxA family with amidase domain
MAPLLAWIDAHLGEPLTLPSLAAQARTSTRTLSRRFQAETGRGVRQWIGERRVAHARALLEESDLSVTDVAFATGFGSLGAFRREFSRTTGTTPRDYRHTFRQS